MTRPMAVPVGAVNFHPSHQTAQPMNSPDLAAVVEAWPDLPEALKAGIVAMVKAGAGGQVPLLAGLAGLAVRR